MLLECTELLGDIEGTPETKKMDEKHSILLKPICELPVSKEFMEMAALNHFENLEQIVQKPIYELDKLPLFGARMQYELISTLMGYGMERMLKES
jgi:DNA-directed RNA polymerase alpha subunit